MPARVSASVTSWLASSCTDARCWDTALISAGLPWSRYTPNGDQRAGVLPSVRSSAGLARPGSAHRVTRGREPSAARAASVSARAASVPARPPTGSASASCSADTIQRGWLYLTDR